MDATPVMTAEFAKKLLAYVKHARVTRMKHRDNTEEEVTLGEPSRELVNHMLHRYGGRCLVFRFDGLGLRTKDLRAECEVARLMLKKLKDTSDSSALTSLDDPSGWNNPHVTDDSDEYEPGKKTQRTASSNDTKKSVTQDAAPKPGLTRSIPKAYRWVICEAEKASQKLKSAKDSQPDRMQLLEALGKRTERRLPRVTPAMIGKVSALAEDYPNFEHVVRYICRKLKLRHLLRQPVHIPPLLLSGPPGVGKTQFLKTLSEVLTGSFTFLNIGEVTAGFVLTGQSRGWSEGAVGMVARSIIEAPDGKVVMIMLDELDKTAREANFPPDRSLLGLLEPHTAAHFRDESLEIDLDTRPVCWFLTCNDIKAVRPEIVSRVHHLAVSIPTQAQMPRIVRSIDSALRQRTPAMSKVFEPLDDAVADELSALPPRIVARVLEEAYGRAAETSDTTAKRLRLSPTIVGQAQAALIPERVRSRPVGFLH